MTKLKLRKVKEPDCWFGVSKNATCLALSAKPSHVPGARHDIFHIKTLLLTLSTNKPKNVTHVGCTALAEKGTLASLIMCR